MSKNIFASTCCATTLILNLLLLVGFFGYRAAYGGRFDVRFGVILIDSRTALLGFLGTLHWVSLLTEQWVWHSLDRLGFTQPFQGTYMLTRLYLVGHIAARLVCRLL